MTRAELAADPERHLTQARLEKKAALDLIAMDVAAIPRHLLTDYFFRLSLVDLDRAAANLERLGYEEDLEDAWFLTMFAAVRAGRKDIAERMMALRRPFGLKEEDLRLSQRLLLARDEPSKWLRLVEEAARNGLKTENADGLLDLAFSVAMSDQSALGLILYRGVLPFVPPDKVGSNYENIVLPVRERLNMPADDPLKEYLDNRSVDADLALQQAEAKFEAKRREVRAQGIHVQIGPVLLAREDEHRLGEELRVVPREREQEEHQRGRCQPDRAAAPGRRDVTEESDSEPVHDDTEQDRAVARKGGLSLLSASAFRVDRGRARPADDEPVRPQCRTGGASLSDDAELRDNGPAPGDARRGVLQSLSAAVSGGGT